MCVSLSEWGICLVACQTPHYLQKGVAVAIAT